MYFSSKQVTPLLVLPLTSIKHR